MIKNIFKKDINRQIEGVIKADNLDSEAVFQEIDEYVITKEIHKRLDEFFSEYSNSIGKPTTEIGAWISGHFGSGKSHLLKILSYILSSDEKYDRLIKELFLTKIDDNDFELKANIQKALNSPSDTILFNIEQKVDTQNKDSILEVFVRVFNEFRGYYSKIPYIAEFEKDLDKKGKFIVFKEKFKEISGESWESGRELILLESDNIAKALSEVDDISFESAKDIIKKYEANYKISIEDFAKEVKEFISKKDKDYRLIFCVDEVGQFIGDNTKLMLSLQTLVESLSVECKGSAWIIVTSQSAVDEIVNSNIKIENDFSKILGRFKIKLNLTSQNANEVIQKRLLEKKDEVKEDLGAIYKKIENSLKSILRFEGQTRNYKSFNNKEEFINWYPFIPYQLELFQSAIKSLSMHNIFQGKHQSTGERSMLDVVQYVTKQISNEEIGSLVTFDRFFDGISSIIKAEYQTEINKAEEILDEFSFKVLKTLFLVKYIKEFESNLNNITVLLIDSVNANFNEIKERVKLSLNKLIQNTYIQKVGNRYEYLTNIEKDIQEEIKLVEVSDSEFNRQLIDWIYDDIIKITKTHNYNFSKKLNDNLKGKEFELSLNIITENLNDIYKKSIASSDLIFYAPFDFELEEEIKSFIKTSKYLPQKQSSNLSIQEKAILETKREENIQRRENIFKALNTLLSECDIYFNGERLEINSKDILNRINEGFRIVIDAFYPYLKSLSKKYSEDDISVILSKGSDLFKEEALLNIEEEVLNRIDKHTLLKDIISFFSKRPYGFDRVTILAIVAMLKAKEIIDIKEHSTPLSYKELKTKLLNSRYEDKLLLSKKISIDSKKLKQVKEILQDIGVVAKNEEELFKDFLAKIKDDITKLQKAYNYPFKSKANKLIDYLKALNIDYEEFFDFVIENEDELIEKFEEIEELIEFLEGDKAKIYNEVKNFFEMNKANLKYIGEIDLSLLVREDIYKHIPKLKNLYETTKAKIDEMLKVEKDKALKEVDLIIEEIQNLEEFQKVDISKRNDVLKGVLNLKEKIKSSLIIDEIRQLVDKNKIINNVYEKIAEFTEEEIKVKNIVELIPKVEIKSKEDVEKFVEELKNRLLDELNNNTKIII